MGMTGSATAIPWKDRKIIAPIATGITMVVSAGMMVTGNRIITGTVHSTEAVRIVLIIPVVSQWIAEQTIRRATLTGNLLNEEWITRRAIPIEIWNRVAAPPESLLPSPITADLKEGIWIIIPAAPAR